MSWFDVSKKGLKLVLGRQTHGRAIAELIANAWDEPGVTEVEVSLQPIGGVPKVRVAVLDNSPNGFADLSHAYTLFAESVKKTNPEQRGRFNVGEKLFLARCDEAEIISTTGHVRFNAEGTRTSGRQRRDAGTLLTAVMPMTRAEYDQARDELELLIAPPGIDTQIVFPDQTVRLTRVEPEFTFEVTLPTEIADVEGALRTSERKTVVEVWRRAAGRTGMLYEMGIPVVELDVPFAVSVGQKIPLTVDRENVRPSFIKRLSVAVLDHTHRALDATQATAPWVTDALEKAAPDTVSNVLDQRFGKKRVSFDPSDPEASKRAVSEGYTVVTGGALPASVWANVRKAGAIKPAGQVTPTKHPRFSPDGKDCTVPYAKWSEGMRATVKHLQVVGAALLEGRTGLSIEILSTSQYFAACYSRGGSLLLNLRRLGKDWFERGKDGLAVEHVDLLIHELGHEWCSDHLAVGYHDALTNLGARLALRATNDLKVRRALRRTGE